MATTTAAIARQAKKKKAKDTCPQFGVGIPHYNHGLTIARPLRNLLNHPSVSEVVIVDDASEQSEFDQLCKTVKTIDFRGMVRIYRRELNQGALLTKLECVEKSQADWVLVLDCDNTAFKSYLDKLAAIEPKDPEIIYCASWAFPHFPFHSLVGAPINFLKASQLLRSGKLKKFYLLNDGNYLVNRTRYSRLISSIGKLPSDIADTLVANYLWLSSGGKLQVLPGTSYLHRVEENSFWSRTAEPSRKRLNHIYSRIQEGNLFDEKFLSDLKNSLI